MPWHLHNNRKEKLRRLATQLNESAGSRRKLRRTEALEVAETHSHSANDIALSASSLMFLVSERVARRVTRHSWLVPKVGRDRSSRSESQVIRITGRYAASAGRSEMATISVRRVPHIVACCETLPMPLQNTLPHKP
jgi:hypothetical protein